MNAQTKLVTILVPNYKTPEITKICMRLLRKHTDFSKAKVIVIDNNSADASLAYLRSLSWIKLIERKPNKSETGIQSHAEALDMGMIEVKTPYVLSIHTDTFVKHNDWLKILLAPFRGNPRLAGVGSWKLESKNAIQRFGVHFEQAWKNICMITLAINAITPSV